MAFFALPIPRDIQSQLAEGLSALRQKWPQVQWVHPEDYHLTLRFIGGMQTEAIDRLLVEMKGQALPFTPFPLELQGLYSFPPKRDRGVLWIGLQSIMPQLLDLQLGLEQLVQGLGFTPESRAFTPHLTVGRYRATDAALIQETLPTFADRRWAAITCQEYVLMKRRSGARDDAPMPLYEVLARFSV